MFSLIYCACSLIFFPFIVRFRLVWKSPKGVLWTLKQWFAFKIRASYGISIVLLLTSSGCGHCWITFESYFCREFQVQNTSGEIRCRARCPGRFTRLCRRSVRSCAGRSWSSRGRTWPDTMKGRHHLPLSESWRIQFKLFYVDLRFFKLFYVIVSHFDNWTSI